MGQGRSWGVCTEEVLAHPAVPQVFAETPFFCKHSSSVTSLELHNLTELKSVLGKTMCRVFSGLFVVNRLNFYKLFLTSGKQVLKNFPLFHF